MLFARSILENIRVGCPTATEYFQLEILHKIVISIMLPLCQFSLFCISFNYFCDLFFCSEKCKEAARQANADEFIMQFPEQYNTPVCLFKVPYRPFQSTTPPSSKYHTTLFKVPYHSSQNIIPPSSKYHTTIFKVPHHSLPTIIQPSS